MSDARRDACAFVTGGSSGIGLAVALRLAKTHSRIGLFARDPQGLAQAADRIRRENPGTDVRGFVLDVADQDAVCTAIAAAVAQLGAPRRLVLSAGMVELGETSEIGAALHRRVMDVNYFGCLWVVRATLPHLSSGAVIGLVGSAGGIVGIYGYAAYAPSKFALRGLAEILRVELAGQGIGVTLCLPPDTETPMLEKEDPLRSPVTARIAAGAQRMTAEAVAEALLAGMDRGRFLVLPNRSVRLFWFFAPFLLPFLQARQQNLLRRLAAGSAHMFADHVDEHRQNAPGEKTYSKDKGEG